MSTLPTVENPSTVTSLVVLRLSATNAGGLSLVPGQGTRSPTPQLRAQMPQLKIPHAAMKIEGPMRCN